MIASDVAKEQVKRLTVLRDFPGTEEAVKELMIAVQCAEDVPHAAQTIDNFIHSGNDFCPGPAAIRRALFETKPEAPAPPATIDEWGRCACKGWGMVGEPPNVRFCSCAVGRSLQADIVTWARPIYEGVAEDGKGPKEVGARMWTPEEWLELANGTASKGMGRATVPRSFLTGFEDTLASGTRGGAVAVPRRKRMREPGED